MLQSIVRSGTTWSSSELLLAALTQHGEEIRNDEDVAVVMSGL